jgi:hypothetical protein
MEVFSDDTDINDCLYWQINAAGDPIRFYVESDGEREEITPANLSVLEQAIADVTAAEVGAFWALQLFVGRVRGKPVSTGLLRHAPGAVMPLFDAIGPPR